MNKAIHIQMPCSRMAQKIEMVRQIGEDEIIAATGTGSYWVHENRWYLITNWHNVTGCNPLTMKALSSQGITPTHLRLRFLHTDPIDQATAQFWWDARLFPLYSNGCRPLWLEHPVFGSRVDVIALELFVDSDVDDTIFSLPINRYKEWFDFNVMPGDRCFVLGYPKGLDGGFHLPLWKGASIASEPSWDHSGLPRILIDTATRPGMSGAPVIAVSNGYHIPLGGTRNDAVFGRVEAFLGVYSGRIDDDPLGAQIGIVWKSEVIDKILECGVSGSNPLNCCYQNSTY